jgi:hypothetical protein
MKRLLLSPTLMVAALFAPSSARACVCLIHGDGSASAMMRDSKVVFFGEVLDVKGTTKWEQEDGVTQYAVRFRIERYWKGVKGSETTVHTDLHGCGPNLKVGHKYLVYAVGKGRETGCTRTRPIAEADEDLRALGAGKSLNQSSGEE